jgi:coatomer protein complex subunit gamma
MGAAAHFMAELKFRVVEVDPGTGEIEGDEEGFHEEYPLEDVEISTTDFMAKASIGEFRQVWESIDKTQEVLQKFSLQFKDMKVAIAAVIACLGMRPEDHTNDVDDASLGKPHMLHLSGTFAGNICILVRAQLHIEERLGCILKIAVRSSDIEISQLVADCIK